MIISLTRRFVFVHLHKCAGTSIEVALAPHLGLNDLLIGSTREGERDKRLLKQLTGLQKHATAAAARDTLGAEAWGEFYSFGFVRHPIDRLYSLYTYARGLVGRKPLTAEEAAAHAATGALPDRPPYKYKAAQAAFLHGNFNDFLCDARIWKDEATRPQWQGLCGEQGETLVNFVGQVERIEQDWATVQKRLGLSALLGKQNESLAPDGSAPLSASTVRSQRTGWEDQGPLSKEAWERIRRHCLRDFRLFGYPSPGELRLAVADATAARRAQSPAAANPIATPAD